MKTYGVLKMTLMALLLGVVFAACSKTDIDEPQATEKKLVKMTGEMRSTNMNANTSKTFSYDTKGRLKEATATTVLPDNTLTHIYTYVWNTYSINVIEAASSSKYPSSQPEQYKYTMHLSNGLVRGLTYEEYPTDNVSYNYDSSNRINYSSDGYNNIYNVWDNDKLVSITQKSGSDESIYTFTYGESHTINGYMPLIPNEFSIDPLFVAHPELGGMKSSQIYVSSTNTWTGTPHLTNTFHYEYEFDNEGYISKITSVNKIYSSEYTYTFTWE